eukprot:TRINITY_DN11779_c0_g1_i1.p1 TRINITY_DN11779_c0_g1~~TRINITY_DN11779_c0_g1_i1.p1  ORF type:complete len:288 (+),score=46.50 TRINITY_DN11779_c0_g1_i1:147-1010(+)
MCIRDRPSIKRPAPCTDINPAPTKSATGSRERPGNMLEMMMSAARPRPAPALNQYVAHEHPVLSGQFTVLDFLTSEEERTVLSFVDGSGLETRGGINGPHSSRSWGVRTNLKTQTLHPPVRPVPPELRFVIERMRGTGFVSGQGEPRPVLKQFRPNECNSISYVRSRGDQLRHHCDHRSLSGPILVNLSLGADAIMSYKPANGVGPAIRVLLPARSLQVQNGKCRYDYRQGIANDDLPLIGRRVSITFRQNVANYGSVSYTHLRAHETVLDLVCRLLLEKKKKNIIK